MDGALDHLKHIQGLLDFIEVEILLLMMYYNVLSGEMNTEQTFLYKMLFVVLSQKMSLL